MEPAGQISMMHQELVEKRRWISEHRFLHALTLHDYIVPGPAVEATRHEFEFTTPLTGITAAIVGLGYSLLLW